MSVGYVPCACRDCMEIAIGKAGKAFCLACEESGCETDEECQCPPDNEFEAPNETYRRHKK